MADQMTTLWEAGKSKMLISLYKTHKEGALVSIETAVNAFKSRVNIAPNQASAPVGADGASPATCRFGCQEGSCSHIKSLVANIYSRSVLQHNAATTAISYHGPFPGKDNEEEHMIEILFTCDTREIKDNMQRFTSEVCRICDEATLELNIGAIKT